LDEFKTAERISDKVETIYYMNRGRTDIDANGNTYHPGKV